MGLCLAGLFLTACSAEHVVGSLGFGVATRYGATAAAQLAVGDFDGDGNQDVATQGSDGKTLCLRPGSVDGTLGPARCQMLADAATAIAALTQPAGPAVLLRASGALSTWMLGADGRFGRHAVLPLSGSATARVMQLVDLDADGSTDVLIAESGPNQIEAVLAGPSGLRSAGVYPLLGAAKSVLYRDLDGDRHPELTVLESDSLELWGERGLARWSGCSNPQFSQPVGLWPIARWLKDESALLVVDAGTGLLGVIRSQSAKDFVFACGEVALLPGVAGQAVSGWLTQAADVDGDGEQELLLAEPSGRINVFRGQDGDVSRLTDASFGAPVLAMTLADLNHDELPEILAITRSGDEVLVLSNLFRK